MSIPKPALWLALASTCGAALAQQAPPTAATQPPPAPPAYRSVLEDYRPFADEKVAPWRESNDTVGKIGGWRAYARETAAPAPAGPAAAPAVPDGHKHEGAR